MNKATAQMILRSHPDAQRALVGMGLTLADAELEKNIGRRVRFINWEPKMGTLTRDFSFTIIGVQRTIYGEKAYRVTCDGYADSFGRPARPSEIEFLG
jgi:hypothetical protein